MTSLTLISSLVAAFINLALACGLYGQAGSVVGEDYSISPGDVVTLSTFDDPKGSPTTGLRVSRNGMIEHPYLGAIKIAGLTESGASRKLEGLLRGDYLVNPRVSITVVSFTKITFVVLGAVNAPNTFTAPANKRITLLSAIAQAGDFKDVANRKKVQLLRQVNGVNKAYTVNVKEMLEDSNSAPVYIQDGDTIRVKESFL